MIDPDDSQVVLDQQFTEKEICCSQDGWTLYKKPKHNVQALKKYIHLLDRDYPKNKITVSANLSNLFNSFCTNHPNATLFDHDKWLLMYD